PEDRDGQRVAFMEAFRKRGILPPEIRTVSDETLAWNTLENPRPDWLTPIIEAVDLNLNRDLDRSEIFDLNNKNPASLHGALKQVFAKDPSLLEHFGLLPGIDRYDQKGKVMRPVTAHDTTFEVHSVRPARRMGPDGSFHTDLVVV